VNALGNSLRAMVELFSLRTSGLNSGFRIEDGIPVGLVCKPEFWFHERYGRVCDKAINSWFYDYVVPALARTGECLGKPITEETAEAISMDIMFFEVDPTHTVVMEAWYGYDLIPHDYSGIESIRDLDRSLPPEPTPEMPAEASNEDDGQEEGEKEDPSIKYDLTSLQLQLDGTFLRGPAVLARAQLILNNISLTSADPYEIQAFVDSVGIEQPVPVGVGSRVTRALLDPPSAPAVVEYDCRDLITAEETWKQSSFWDKLLG
jgi:hypothetical protein